MCDELVHPGLVEGGPLTRRAFGVTMAAATGVAGSALGASEATETDVEVKTADGVCDAVLFHPQGKGPWPAVLIWPDIMGLRPAFRDMGRRLAAEGYVVLVPNPFYRSHKAPVVEGRIDFNNQAERARLFGYRQAMSDEGIDSDARAYLGFLDAQRQTDKTRKAGVQGYCMGGALSFRTAAAVSDRVGAVASFHGGNGLVTDKPNSPHLLIGKSHATYLVCQAQNDDAQNPKMKDDLKAAFAAAGRPATIEVYPADHGWCVPGGQVYDAAQAERAWAALTELYKASL